jgi:hypothetical protein
MVDAASAAPLARGVPDGMHCAYLDRKKPPDSASSGYRTVEGGPGKDNAARSRQCCLLLKAGISLN